MIYTELSKHEAFDMIRNAQFMENRTIEGFDLLFEYYEELSEEMGESINFDPVAWYSYCYEIDKKVPDIIRELNLERGQLLDLDYDPERIEDIIEYLREEEDITLLEGEKVIMVMDP